MFCHFLNLLGLKKSEKGTQNINRRLLGCFRGYDVLLLLLYSAVVTLFCKSFKIEAAKQKKKEYKWSILIKLLNIEII